MSPRLEHALARLRCPSVTSLVIAGWPLERAVQEVDRMAVEIERDNNLPRAPEDTQEGQVMTLAGPGHSLNDV